MAAWNLGGQKYFQLREKKVKSDSAIVLKCWSPDIRNKTNKKNSNNGRCIWQQREKSYDRQRDSIIPESIIPKEDKIKGSFKGSTVPPADQSHPTQIPFLLWRLANKASHRDGYWTKRIPEQCQQHLYETQYQFAEMYQKKHPEIFSLLFLKLPLIFEMQFSCCLKGMWSWWYFFTS